MKSNEVYRPPESTLSMPENTPPVIKMVYGLIGVFVLLGFVDGFIVAYEGDSFLELNFIFLIFYYGITLLIANWMYQPVANRQQGADKMPLFLFVLLTVLALVVPYEQTYELIIQYAELVVLLFIFIALKTNVAKAWCCHANEEK